MSSPPPEVEKGLELSESILLSATYDGTLGKAVIKFYQLRDQRVYLWYDDTGHKPYCFVRMEKMDDELRASLLSRSDVSAIDYVERRDLLNDKVVKLAKIITRDPLVIGGSGEKAIRNITTAWEADIKYYENYLYDSGLIPGALYEVQNRRIIPVHFDSTFPIGKVLTGRNQQDGDFHKAREEWVNLLSQPLPVIRRVALDIEVVAPEKDRLPNPDEAKHPVIAVSLVSNDGLKEVYLLNRPNTQLGFRSVDPEVQLHRADDETVLLSHLFKKIQEYPCIITFNGDDFDLRYLYNRAKVIGLQRADIPITMGRDFTSIKNGIHIDLYKTFINRSLQIYAFGNRYVEHSLNGVSAGLLGESKIEFDGFIGDLPLYELARYCYQDSLLAFKLTSFDNDLLMKLLLVISRVAKMPIDDVSRLGVSNWIRSMMYFEHRKRGALIPRKEELEKIGSSSSTAIIKGKKYKGGMVVNPTTGVHFNVSVLDFSSLYPSIIKVNNLSYETVRCVHQEDKLNLIKGTDHWICKKRRGISSLVIGSLRDVRVDYYKQLPLVKGLNASEKSLYQVVSQALKVILNASYGVMGADLYPLYCLPVADATASIGRNVITETIEKAKKIGMEVVYGDTDSLFLKAPTTDQIERITKWASDELGVELELEKTYRYVAFSSRKKNYLGVMADGSVDIKGLTGKKSHVPRFIRDGFYDAVATLSKVRSESDFKNATQEIKEDIRKRALRLRQGDVPLEQLAFHVMLGKSIEGYAKGIKPQHVRAAEQLRAIGKREIRAGNIIQYVKTIGREGVKPLELAKPSEIDKKKYEEMMQSTFDQLLDSLGYSFDEVLGATRLEDLFWK
ncbi:MAG: DNA-directed DNA polymerase I [Nitrososphaerales archaeon]